MKGKKRNSRKSQENVSGKNGGKENINEADEETEKQTEREENIYGKKRMRNSEKVRDVGSGILSDKRKVKRKRRRYWDSRIAWTTEIYAEQELTVK